MKKETHLPPWAVYKDQAKFKVRVEKQLNTLDEVYEVGLWTEQNLKGKVVFDVRYVWFELEEDAILFKLTWA